PRTARTTGAVLSAGSLIGRLAASFGFDELGQCRLGLQKVPGDAGFFVDESCRRHRNRDRMRVAQMVRQGDTGSANPERVLLPVKSKAPLAHLFQLGKKIVQIRDRAWCAPLE